MSKVEDMLQVLIDGGDIANYNPQSEIEVWLKKIILGESDETLPATSRLTKLLKVVANEGIVGGGGTDTSSATALPSDVLKGKTFFNVNGLQEGTIESYDGTFEGEATPNTVEQMLIDIIDGNATDLVLPEGPTKIRRYLFHRDTMITSITISKTIKEIGAESFFNCVNLTKVVCLGEITRIDNSAFYYCQNCLEFDFSNCSSVPTLGSMVFNSISSKAQIKVPSALLNDFKSATNWSTYADNIVGV